jgi:hypothetical protein
MGIYIQPYIFGYLSLIQQKLEVSHLEKIKFEKLNFVLKMRFIVPNSIFVDIHTLWPGTPCGIFNTVLSPLLRGFRILRITENFLLDFLETRWSLTSL